MVRSNRTRKNEESSFSSYRATAAVASSPLITGPSEKFHTFEPNSWMKYG